MENQRYRHLWKKRKTIFYETNMPKKLLLKIYFLKIDETIWGPTDFKYLKKGVKLGIIKKDSVIGKKTDQNDTYDWFPAKSIPGLFARPRQRDVSITSLIKSIKGITMEDGFVIVPLANYCDSEDAQ